ncbi:hypothetical protein HYQ46_012901 [Verticillium longisporum]|nr:hypothetical protein HYQ46_012901 [Verticillium longisporum]
MSRLHCTAPELYRSAERGHLSRGRALGIGGHFLFPSADRAACLALRARCDAAGGITGLLFIRAGVITMMQMISFGPHMFTSGVLNFN